MSHWSKSEHQRILEELRRRSAVDPAFRQLALTNPTAAIAALTTKPIPADVTYTFVDNSGPVKTIPLPDPLPASDELTDLELERVAGGDGVTVAAGWGR